MRELLRRCSPTHDLAPVAERSAVPKAIGVLALPCAVVVLVWLLTPHSAAADETVALGLLAVAGIFGLLFVVLGERQVATTIAVLMACDSVLIGAGAYFAATPLSPVPLFFVWVVPFGFALYGVWHALLQAAIVGVVYAVVLALLPAAPGVSDLAAWTGVMVSVLVVGFSVRAIMLRFREADERYRRGFEGSSVGMALNGEDHRYLQVNDALCRFLGRPAEVLVGTDPVQWTDPRDVPATLAFYADRESTQQLDKRYRRPDGSVVWGRVNRSPVRDSRGRISYYLTAIEDVTEHKEAEAERAAAAVARARRARINEAGAELGRLVVEVTDPDELATRVAELLTECLDADQSGILESMPGGALRVMASAHGGAGKTPGELITSEPRTLTSLALSSREPVAVTDLEADPRLEPSSLLQGAGVRSAVACALRRPGETIGVIGAFSSAPREWEPEERQFLAVVAAMLASAIERSRAEADARRRALHDPLTGLPNRTLFLDRLAGSLGRMRRGGPPPAVLLLDLDGFKVVNDSLGHHAGDQLLRAIAPRLEAATRDTDTVARLGGDEFVVLADGVEGEAAALALAHRLADAWREPVRVGDVDLHLTASVGVALSGPDGEPDSLLRDADAAMYHAKGRGRGRVELFGAPLRDEALRRLALEQDLRRALEAGELRLVYQPIADLRTGAIRSCEALLRWTHPERGPVGPDEFIAVAEDSGLIVPIGRWVLRTACETALGWPEHLGIGVNLSARQVADPDLCDHVREVLEATGLEPARLTLEITESTLMEESEAALRTLDALRATGIRLALDDFGTGYSSLSYLRRFELDVLKVDRSFVRDLETDPQAALLVEAVVSMASGLGLEVVAEGIETPAQRTRLVGLGCELGQGYLLSRPVPAAELRARLVAATIPA